MRPLPRVAAALACILLLASCEEKGGEASKSAAAPAAPTRAARERTPAGGSRFAYAAERASARAGALASGPWEGGSTLDSPERAAQLLQLRFDGGGERDALASIAEPVSAVGFGGSERQVRPALDFPPQLRPGPQPRPEPPVPAPPAPAAGPACEDRSPDAFARLRDAFYDFQTWFSGTVASTLLPREEWSARVPKKTLDAQVHRHFVVHHTAEAEHFTADEARAKEWVNLIQKNHMYQMEKEKRGENMDDIGYHFLISRSGTIYEGRWHWSRGAHAGSKEGNDDAIGIALLGNFESQKPTPAQLASLERLMIFMTRQYAMDPTVSEFLEGHVHYSPGRDCPGKHLEGRLGGLRERVRAGVLSPVTVASAPYIARSS